MDTPIWRLGDLGSIPSQLVYFFSLIFALFIEEYMPCWRRNRNAGAQYAIAHCKRGRAYANWVEFAITLENPRRMEVEDDGSFGS